MKKQILTIISLILTIGMILPTANAEETSTYSDYVVEGQSTYADSFGLMKGYDDGTFKPDNNMTRAEFASMIANYKKLDFSKYDDVKLDFTDNDIIPQWAVPAVKAVYKEGIILGRVNDDGTSTFAPYDNITRAEAMTILGRILPNNDDLPNLPFADKNDIPQWAEEGVSKLYSTGIVSGYEDNTILPNNNMKRAEAATMLYKIENK